MHSSGSASRLISQNIVILDHTRGFNSRPFADYSPYPHPSQDTYLPHLPEMQFFPLPHIELITLPSSSHHVILAFAHPQHIYTRGNGPLQMLTRSLWIN